MADNPYLVKDDIAGKSPRTRTVDVNLEESNLLHRYNREESSFEEVPPS